ncbi:hypothetical protein ACA910_009562 [Epithemia clementina (nom. ined.)]
MGEQQEIGYGVLGTLVEFHSIFVTGHECDMELGEEALASQDAQNHAAKFAKEFVCLFKADTVFPMDFVQDQQ